MSRLGVREITDVVIKDIKTGKPVLYLESLKTSSTEVTADSVYARGGKGNPKRISWEGNKEVVYNMQDALISPEALALLVGNELKTGAKKAHKKETLDVVENTGIKTITLTETPSTGAKMFVFKTQEGYDIGEELELTTDYTIVGKVITIVDATVNAGDKILVDYYFDAPITTKSIVIDATKFSGVYMLEASTLWRRESDGVDLPALFTMPKIKIQSGFKIDNQADGDPSVFDFKVDCFPNSENEMAIIDILE